MLESKTVIMVVSLSVLTQTATAAEIIAKISGATADSGKIGCALFASENGFPMDGSKATQQSHRPINGSAVCRFANLTAGVYAIGSAHDANGNGKTDTNFLGIPKEVWGVSNNVRPKLRAPTFQEAKFSLGDGEVLTIAIELNK